VPLTGNNWMSNVEIEGQPPAAKPSDQIAIPLRAVTPDYFKLLGLPLTDGRDFRATDSGQTVNVAVVNQALAERYFPHSPAVGKKLWLGDRKSPPTEIIGVVANGRTDDLTKPAGPEIYLSLWEASAFSKHLVIRTSADPRTMIAAVERELRAVDPTAAVENVKTLDDIRGDSLASRTFAMQLLVGFSVIGSVLTLVGIYGVLSLSVASRRREIAIRTAVGAERRDIHKLIFAQGFRLIAGGVVSGIAAALILSRVLRTFLFEVEPTDPATLIGVGLLFAGVAMLACWIPTHRAAKIAPLEALRYE
jgi:putative ABC transport system permease protein